MDLDETGFVNIAWPEGVPEFMRGTPVVGLVYVSGWLEGNGGTNRCEGSGWVRLVGDPTFSVPWSVGLVLFMAGAVLLVATPYTIDWEEGGYSGEIPGGDPGATPPPPPPEE